MIHMEAILLRLSSTFTALRTLQQLPGMAVMHYALTHVVSGLAYKHQKGNRALLHGDRADGSYHLC
jgi:hypothetical protein